MLLSFLQRMTIACRQRSTRRETCPRDQSLLQARKSMLSQPLQHFLRRSLAYDPQARAKSATPIRLSFAELSEDPIPLKRCVLWNRRAFMVRIMASAKSKRAGRVWYVKNKPLSAKVSFLDGHVFCPEALQRSPVPALLRAIRCASLLSTFPTRRFTRVFWNPRHATHFPAETSCRILVRVVSSTWPRKHK